MSEEKKYILVPSKYGCKSSFGACAKYRECKRTYPKRTMEALQGMECIGGKVWRIKEGK